MTLNVYEQSVGLFLRGLNNLNAQLAKAEAHAANSGNDPAALLNARLAGEANANDLHTYTLAAQVHWAAEAAKLAIAHLLGAPAAPATNVASTFAQLHQHLDATIAHLEQTAPSDLEAGLDRTIVIQHRRGSTSAAGSQFLLAFAIPHFYYHVTTAYSILRNQGVQLTMSDFLGDWATH